MSTMIVDYGSGNLRSVENALARVADESGAGGPVRVTHDPEEVRQADRIVLPGVGAFADCMAGLTALEGMAAALEHAVITRGRPFLGICVGMQLMAQRGLEHGPTDGFGWVQGEVAPIVPADPALKIPHMGWNVLKIRTPHPVLANLPGPEPHVYFVHSFGLTGGRTGEILAETDYGGPLTAAVGRDNLIGVQFHPEKSQAVGLALLEAFLKWQP